MNTPTPLSDAELRTAAAAAVRAAAVSRGRHKGQLLKTCPRSDTDAAAAWQAIVSHANPYKLSVGTVLLMSARQRQIFDHVHRHLIGRDVRALDRDRVALESLGVW